MGKKKPLPQRESEYARNQSLWTWIRIKPDKNRESETGKFKKAKV